MTFSIKWGVVVVYLYYMQSVEFFHALMPPVGFTRVVGVFIMPPYAPFFNFMPPFCFKTKEINNASSLLTKTKLIESTKPC
jgi:hypothetical protein